MRIVFILVFALGLLTSEGAADKKKVIKRPKIDKRTDIVNHDDSIKHSGDNYQSLENDVPDDSKEQRSSPYQFGYEIHDELGNMQSRKETSDENNHRKGSYSFTDVHGFHRRVDYIADEHGFRATVHTNEPGTRSRDSAGVHMVADEENNDIENKEDRGKNPEEVLHGTSEKGVIHNQPAVDHGSQKSIREDIIHNTHEENNPIAPLPQFKGQFRPVHDRNIYTTESPPEEIRHDQIDPRSIPVAQALVQEKHDEHIPKPDISNGGHLQQNNDDQYNNEQQVAHQIPQQQHDHQPPVEHHQQIIHDAPPPPQVGDEPHREQNHHEPHQQQQHNSYEQPQQQFQQPPQQQPFENHSPPEQQDYQPEPEYPPQQQEQFPSSKQGYHPQQQVHQQNQQEYPLRPQHDHDQQHEQYPDQHQNEFKPHDKHYREPSVNHHQRDANEDGFRSEFPQQQHRIKQQFHEQPQQQNHGYQDQTSDNYRNDIPPLQPPPVKNSRPESDYHPQQQPPPIRYSQQIHPQDYKIRPSITPESVQSIPPPVKVLVPKVVQKPIQFSQPINIIDPPQFNNFDIKRKPSHGSSIRQHPHDQQVFDKHPAKDFQRSKPYDQPSKKSQQKFILLAIPPNADFATPGQEIPIFAKEVYEPISNEVNHNSKDQLSSEHSHLHYSVPSYGLIQSPVQKYYKSYSSSKYDY